MMILEILSLSQADLYKTIGGINGAKVYDKHIIWKQNNNPKPMLCVHLDTINTAKNDKTHDKKNFVVNDNIVSLHINSDMNCLGGDDRAGVYIALQLIKHMEETKDYKYDIGFFCDEEVGCIGSSVFDKHKHKYETTCYIGLDRRSKDGKDEVALYGYDNEDLTNIFCELGYKEEYGSVTDASNLAGDIACINLSVGYENEHTKREILHIDAMERTLSALKEVEFANEAYEAYDSFEDRFYSYGYKDEDISYGDRYENDIFREALWDMGIDPDEVLREYNKTWNRRWC